MPKSLCIKTNNKYIINYLLEKFETSPLKNTFFSNSEFKFFNNIIIHYKGNKIDDFYSYVSEILSDTIILFYEDKLIKNILDINYFYFSEIEKQSIFKTCMDYLSSVELKESIIRRSYICFSIYEYLFSNKNLLLDGFVNFRIKDYIKILDYIINLSVNKFVIDREYTEFIDLLKLYINSNPSKIKILHLIYKNEESILLDSKKNLINLKSNMFDTKYLSDISFSSNDFALNSLLTLLPEEIIVHIIDKEDDFINTLKLIFNKRIFICTDCKLCNLYKFENNKLKI